MMSSQVHDGVVAFTVLAVNWSINDPGAVIPSSRVVVLDIADANASEMGNASRFGRALLVMGFGDNDRANCANGELRAV